MFAGAYAVVVVLTCLLVAMNVRAVVQQYVKDYNVVRLYCYLATLLIMGSSIIGVSSAIVQRVIDAESMLQTEVSPSVRFFHH